MPVFRRYASLDTLLLLFTATVIGLATNPAANAQTLLSSETASDPLTGRDFVELDGFVFFSATSFSHLGSVWKTDGTPNGTAPIFSTPPAGSSAPLILSSDGNVLAFVAESADETTNDLWTSDGTTVGTIKRVVGISVDERTTYETPKSITIVNGHVLAYARPWVFSLDTSTGDSTNLFRADNDVKFAKAQSGFAYAFVTNFDIETNGLVRTDGTPEGTLLLESGIVPAGEEYIGIVGDRLVMIADSFTGAGDEIFISDGTVEGSEYLPEQIVGDEPIDCSDVSSDGQFVYFGIRSPDLSNCKPIRSDGTVAGTEPIVDFAGLQLKFFGSTEDYVFFVEGTGTYWRTDGTTEGTIELGDFGVAFSPVVGFNGKGYFVALDLTTGGTRLYESDGTPEGTVAIFRAPEDATGPITGLQVLGNRLYFSAYTTFFIEGTPTGVDGVFNESEFKITVFPNPTRDRVSIQRVGARTSDRTDLVSAEPIQLTVYDVLGRQVTRQTAANLSDPFQLDLSELPSGVYFLTTRSNSATESTKIVKTR